MDNIEKLIEKYKRDMINLSRRNVFGDEYIPRQEEAEEIKPAAAVLEPTPVKVQTDTPAAVKEPDKEEHFGSLKVIVFAGNEAFPVETARVEVFDKNGKELYSLLTNSGGIAEGMILPAPNKSESEAPGGDDGFSTYSVRVSHPDYGTQVFDGVQVFEGVESVQPVFFHVENSFFKRKGE
ncbi:MAG: carboxypeptidase-like regulatory domain-containing protein [Acutalibacteraceae bacterium]